MYPAGNMRQARANILAQGIQQTNRYRISYNSAQSGSIHAYPYAITLPGYGYDLIDHSIWSINRKIPFRRSNTEVELTFIVGNSNYANYIYFWNNLLGNPKKNKPNKIQSAEEIGGFSQNSGAAAYEVNEAFGQQGSNVPPKSGNIDPNTGQPVDSETGSYGISFQDPTPPTPAQINKGTNARTGRPGEAGVWGGAVPYMDEIYGNTLIVNLLDEDMMTRNIFSFDEAYISQISEVQLTSAETGYSPFKVSFRFANMISNAY